MPTLEERINALEDAIATVGEGGQQSFIIVTPTGVVTYDFEGIIHALGLVLPMGDVANSPDKTRIKWERESDSAVGAQMYDYYLSGVVKSLLKVMAIDPDTGSTVRAAINLAVQEDLGASGIHDTVYAETGSSSLVLIDDDDKAGMLLNNFGSSREETRYAFGIKVMPTGGGTPTASDTVNHGLQDAGGNNLTPDVVICCIADATTHAHAKAHSYTPTQFTCVTHMDNEANIGNTDVAWLAIGRV